MNGFHNFVFGIYPYIALTIFLLGSLIRFDRDQYSWKSDSSQLLRAGQPVLKPVYDHIIGDFGRPEPVALSERDQEIYRCFKCERTCHTSKLTHWLIAVEPTDIRGRRLHNRVASLETQSKSVMALGGRSNEKRPLRRG